MLERDSVLLKVLIVQIVQPTPKGCVPNCYMWCLERGLPASKTVICGIWNADYLRPMWCLERGLPASRTVTCGVWNTDYLRPMWCLERGLPASQTVTCSAWNAAYRLQKATVSNPVWKLEMV